MDLLQQKNKVEAPQHVTTSATGGSPPDPNKNDDDVDKTDKEPFIIKSKEELSHEVKKLD